MSAVRKSQDLREKQYVLSYEPYHMEQIVIGCLIDFGMNQAN